MINCDFPFSPANRLFIRTQRFRLIKQVKQYNKEIVRKVKDFVPDLIFVSKGTYLDPRTLREIKNSLKGVKIACYYPDDPFSENVYSANRYTKESIALYDYFFVWSRSLQQKLDDKVAGKVHYVPFGASPQTVNTQTGKLRYQYDLSFIGNGDNERMGWIRGLQILSDGLKVHIFGKNYDLELENIVLHDPIYSEGYFDVFRRSKINLNILRVQNKNAHNMRSFEIPSVGGFMMHEYTDELVEIFEPDIDVVYFSSIDELVDKCKYYLKNEDLRLQISNSAYEKVLMKHTYKHRVAYMFDCMSIDLGRT